MSEKALDEVDTSDVAEVTVIDQATGETISGSLIGTEKDDHTLSVWVDSEME